VEPAATSDVPAPRRRRKMKSWNPDGSLNTGAAIPTPAPRPAPAVSDKGPSEKEGGAAGPARTETEQRVMMAYMS
jgi:hypothetical protein